MQAGLAKARRLDRDRETSWQCVRAVRAFVFQGVSGLAMVSRLDRERGWRSVQAVRCEESGNGSAGMGSQGQLKHLLRITCFQNTFNMRNKNPTL